MRGKFLFGLNESFSRFRKDIFYRDGQRKSEDPPFTPAFVVSQVISFEAAQHTNKLLANSTTEEQVHSPPSTTAHKLVKKLPGRSRPGTFLTDIAFSVAASGNTTVTYAQLHIDIGGTRRALLHPSRGRHVVLELLHPLKRVTP